MKKLKELRSGQLKMNLATFGVRVNKSEGEKIVLSKIKNWILKKLQEFTVCETSSAHIIVNEVQCSDIGCVPIETVVVIVTSLSASTVQR